MLPMGTIMAVSMLLAVIINTELAVIKKVQLLPKMLLDGVAIMVLSSGLWNVFWYASQHLGQFWGNMALMSGLLMILAALYRLLGHKLPAFILSIKPLVLLLLFGTSLIYAVTIYRL